ncbi:MAG: TetR/AcrR family transcriptional regulator [Methanomassiliicoccus sp.]|nr:TetR/AcrR family transcriptional regulator [Methanomassiliicoccus sp.]
MVGSRSGVVNMAGKSNGNKGTPTDASGEKSTRSRIFDVSVDLFAQKGFDAVTMQEIADAVGIKKASLYYHFESKDRILDEILSYPMQRLGEIGGEVGAYNEQLIVSDGLEGFLARSQEVVLSWMETPYIEKIMRIIFVELYHNDRIKEFFGKAVLDAASVFWEQNFAIMMRHGLITEKDPRVLMGEYLSFYSHTWMEYFLFRYGRTAGNYRQEYEDQLSEHTRYMVWALKPEADGCKS